MLHSTVILTILSFYFRSDTSIGLVQKDEWFSIWYACIGKMATRDLPDFRRGKTLSVISPYEFLIAVLSYQRLGGRDSFWMLPSVKDFKDLDFPRLYHAPRPSEKAAPETASGCCARYST